MEKIISVVIPCYCAAKNIEKVIAEDQLIFAEKGINSYEFVLVNDSSPDNTWDVLCRLSRDNPKIKAINLAKNVGQHGAIMAGFHYACGDYIVVSDDDGQTQIDVIDQMIRKLDDGYDVVSTYWKKREKRSFVRKIGTKLNIFVAKTFMDQPDDVMMSIFFAAKRFVIEEVLKYENPYPYVTGLILRTTHNIATIEAIQLERKAGESGYSFRKLLKLWMNGYTAFSVKPLRVSTIIGIFIAIVGIIYGIIIVLRKLIFNDVLLGWSSTTAIILFMSGVILCVLGVLGEYVGRIYMCINKSPQYVVRDALNIDLGKEKDE